MNTDGRRVDFGAFQARPRKARRCNEDEGCDKGDWRRKNRQNQNGGAGDENGCERCEGRPLRLKAHKASLKLKNAYAARASNKGKRDATNGRVAFRLPSRQQQGDAECVCGNCSYIEHVARIAFERFLHEMHDACRREKNRSEVARKGKRAFDRQPGPFDVLRVADNRNPGNLQSAADGAFDRRAVCLLLRSVVHLNSLP